MKVITCVVLPGPLFLLRGGDTPALVATAASSPSAPSSLATAL